MTESNKSLTLKLSLTEKPLSSIIDIDPITRLNLINEKQILKSRNTDVISTKEPKDKSFLLKKYKKIAENLNKLVTSKETQKKVTKPSKNAQTISFDPNDFVYDLTKYDNADESNHIIIDNIEDSKFKINISNIINKEIEKSTQKSNSSINNISTSFKPIPSGNPTPTSFATPADKVINFNTSHANKHAKPSNDIDEQPARKRKMNAGTAVDSKRVAFDLNGPTSLLVEDNKQDGAKQLSLLTGSENNKSGLSFGLGDDKKASSGFGLKRNKDSEEVKNTQFSFGAVAEKKDDVKPSFGFGATTEKKDDAKPAFSFGASTEKKDETKPAFSFGAAAEKKEDVKPAFSFGASTENKENKPAFSFGTSTEKKEETKPAFSFGAAAEKKEDVKPAFSFGASTKNKQETKPTFGFSASTENKQETKPTFGFGASTEKKDDAKPSFGFGASTEKKDDAKPTFSFGASTENKQEAKPTFGFGASTEKKDDTKPSFGFGATAEKKDDAKPTFGFGASTENKQETKPTFGFGASAEKKDDTKPSFGFGATAEKKDDAKPAFSFGASTENKQETKPSFSFGALTEKKEETKPAFSFGAAAEKKEDVKPAFSFGATSSANPKPATDSAFSTNAGSGLSSEKTASRFEGFGASNESAKPKSRFDPTPVARSSAPSGFNFGVNKPAVSPFGNTAPVDNKPAIASPFGTNNNSITPSMPGFSRFENNTPVNQQTGMPPQSTNPDVFKPVSGFNFAAPTQPNMLSGLNSSNTSQSPGQLNFNINSKFKSMSPPQQAQNFQPGAMNFSFGGALPSTNANNMNGSLPPTSNNGMNGFGGTSASGNMAFGGFGGGQQTMNNGAVNGRRIAKLRKR
ncbi:hypothetical protein ACO0OE_003396 [Hanseniaspora uvarum]